MYLWAFSNISAQEVNFDQSIRNHRIAIMYLVAILYPRQFAFGLSIWLDLHQALWMHFQASLDHIILGTHVVCFSPASFSLVLYVETDGES